MIQNALVIYRGRIGTPKIACTFLVQGGLEAPACDCMDFGEVRYGTQKSDKPLVHKITNMTDKLMLCIDAKVLKQPPVTADIPLVADKDRFIKSPDKCLVYKLTLKPSENVTVSYPFFHFSVILKAIVPWKRRSVVRASPAGTAREK
jgi:hypothetical protein